MAAAQMPPLGMHTPDQPEFNICRDYFGPEYADGFGHLESCDIQRPKGKN